MKHWYRKTAVKVTVLLIGVLSGALFATSFVMAAMLAGRLNPLEIVRLADESYEDSPGFQSSVEEYMRQVFEQFRLEELFETDGAYNSGKVIDVMEYAAGRTPGGGNISGVAYTLEELVDWGEDYSRGGDIYDDNQVIVCQEPDGSYYYYYLEDFLGLFNNGSLIMEFQDPYQSQAGFLKELTEGAFPSASGTDFSICDPEGNVIYTDCWNFGQSLREKYPPQGADDLLEVVNSSQELNGQLTTIYNNIAELLNTIYVDSVTYQEGWDYLQEGNTNFTYLYVDETTKKVMTNRSEYSNYADVEKNIEEMRSDPSAKYMFVYPKLRDFETNMNLSPTGEWEAVKAYDRNRDFESIFAVVIDTDYPIHDWFYEQKQNYEDSMPLLRNSLFLSVTGGILFLTSAVWLAMAAGRRVADDKLHLTVFDRCKTEIAAMIVAAVWAVPTVLLFWIMDSSQYPGYPNLAVAFLYAVFTFLCFFTGYVSLIRRIKAKALWNGSLLRAVLVFGSEIVKARSSTAKTAIAVLVFLFLHWLAILIRTLPMLFLILVVDAAAAWRLLSSALAKGRLKKGIEEIASGNLEYGIPLDGLRGEERDMAENVNDIDKGLNKAVDEAMRNERLKTDLITNVSHDIKTPLTSIINYVDILKRSDIKDEKIRGYLDILEAKAQRLKTLTEDVVEASKVSSGNIVLEYMDVDLRELVQQTEGEMAEKFSARNLTMVLNMPEEPAVIHVDGRRMWRVLENIFGNAAKYAMPGTRVYADLSVKDGTVSFSLKNVSEQPLNISADELTERFIRGDISRSTEGSGLGLSIAKSLTAMQGGEFQLYLDGDLFRVDIRFPGKRDFS